MIEVYIDSSSKGNPGPGGVGIVIKKAATEELLSAHGIPLGNVTNNQAEFLALMMDCKHVKKTMDDLVPARRRHLHMR